MDRHSLPPLTRAWLVRLAVLVVVVALLVPSAVSAMTYEPVELQNGTIERPATGSTVIAVQGFKLAGQNSGKKPARLVGVGSEGDLDWLRSAGDDVTWYYDVDPLPGGTLLVTGAYDGGSLVFEYNPESGRQVWSEELGTHDTHDVDRIDDHELVVADMRAYNESTGENHAGLFVYNRTTGEEVYRWEARSIYDESQGNAYEEDWTHANDVEVVDDDRYLLSVRNMDEVILVNRTTDSVEWRLGTDGNHSILHEQHNPDYIESEDGTPTLIVADSENDRIVEYEMVEEGDGSGNSEWERTWTLGVNGSLNWPRDADRLPNGNTLVTDSLNHRVVEVTPEGQVVWEYYAPWGSYEAERVGTGDESAGPTIRDQGAEGQYSLNGSAAITPSASDRPTFADWLRSASAGTPLSGPLGFVADRWAHAIPWIRPVWMTPWAFVSALGAGLVTLGWVTGEVVSNRRTIRRRLRQLVRRVRAAAGDGESDVPEDPGDD